MTKKFQKNNIDDNELNIKLKKLKVQSIKAGLLFIVISTISDFIIREPIVHLDNIVVNIICGLIVGIIYYFMSKSK